MELNKNEQKALKNIFTDYLTDYNAYNMKDRLRVSDVGSLKLLKRLKEKKLLTARKMGNATFYKANLENEYTLKLLELLFLDHSHLSNFVRGWIEDLKSFNNAKGILLFGSILKKEKSANDVDVCFVLEKHEDYKKVQKSVEQMNQKSRQDIHPLYLTEEDLKNKLLENDSPIIEMVRSCVVVLGQELFVRVLKEVQS